MKEQGKNPPDQKNEEDIGSQPEKWFRVMIVKMIQNLRNRMEKIQKTFNKDLEELKSTIMMMMNSTISEMKMNSTISEMMNSTINEIKNSLEGINSRMRQNNG